MSSQLHLRLEDSLKKLGPDPAVVCGEQSLSGIALLEEVEKLSLIHI